MNAFLDPEFTPPFLVRARAMAAEEVAALEQAMNDVRTSLAKVFSEAKRVIARHADDAEVEEAGPADSTPVRSGLPFLSLDEAARERMRLARLARAREAVEQINTAWAGIEQTLRQWDAAHQAHLRKIEIVQARAEQIVASYRRGVLERHARKEDLVPIWKGQVFALDVTGTHVPAKDAFATELASVSDQIEVWNRRRRRQAIEGTADSGEGAPPPQDALSRDVPAGRHDLAQPVRIAPATAMGQSPPAIEGPDKRESPGAANAAAGTPGDAPTVEPTGAEKPSSGEKPPGEKPPGEKPPSGEPSSGEPSSGEPSSGEKADEPESDGEPGDRRAADEADEPAGRAVKARKGPGPGGDVAS